MYQNQADVFDLACNLNKFPTDGFVYFDYWSPVSVEGAEPPESKGFHGHTMQRWASQVIKIKADHDGVKKLVRAAAACIEGPMPEPRLTRSVVARGPNKGDSKLDGCPVCVYLLDRDEVLEAMKVKA
jgi:hypothetical protein